MLRIKEGHVDEMIVHALKEYPNECCGVLAGADEVGKHLYQTTNVVKSPVRYQIDPQEQLDAEQSRFEAGLTTNFFVVQAQRDLSSAQDTELRAILDQQKALVELDRVQRTSLSNAGISIIQ